MEVNGRAKGEDAEMGVTLFISNGKRADEIPCQSTREAFQIEDSYLAKGYTTAIFDNEGNLIE